MSIIDTLKEVVFNETADAGKVCLITWNKEHRTGFISVLVPTAAFNRAKGRATLRAVKIKIPSATQVNILSVSSSVVNYPSATYYLVRAEFKI